MANLELKSSLKDELDLGDEDDKKMPEDLCGTDEVGFDLDIRFLAKN